MWVVTMLCFLSFGTGTDLKAFHCLNSTVRLSDWLYTLATYCAWSFAIGKVSVRILAISKWANMEFLPLGQEIKHTFLFQC